MALLNGKQRHELRLCRKLTRSWLKTQKEQEDDLSTDQLLLLEVVLDGYIRTIREIRRDLGEIE